MPDARLMVLGAGRHQAGLIARAECRGIEVVAVDYHEHSPGKSLATHPVLADALDVAANIEIAARYGVDGVVTVGTDQTVQVMAAVAADRGLPCHVDVDAARVATNKLHMRRALEAAGVPIAPGQVVESPAEIDPALRLPLVVKPVDSQGQRGTSKVTDRAGLVPAVVAALSESRSRRALIEEFVQGPEVTLNGWVHDGTAHLLAINDRLTYNPPPAVGICLQHIYPSRHAAGRATEGAAVLQRIAEAYGMVAGPLYVQVIVGSDRLVVIEAAARVGGGHEASLLPAVGSDDLIDRSIDLALGLPTEAPTGVYRDVGHPVHGLVNFIVAEPGTLVGYAGMEEVLAEGLAAEGGWYHTPGHEQGPIVNSLGRIGYTVVLASDRPSLLADAATVYRRLAAYSPDGRNLVFWPPRRHLAGLDDLDHDPRAAA
jgi:biotin carboxylase